MMIFSNYETESFLKSKFETPTVGLGMRFINFYIFSSF